VRNGCESVSKRSQRCARRRNSGSKRLPWTSDLVIVTSASGPRAVLLGPGVVCSRDANGCSGLGVRKHAIAATVVSKRPGAGGVGRRASAIEPAIKGVSGGGTRRGGIASGGASGPARQLTPQRCARASAQHHRTKMVQRDGVNGRVAMNISMSSRNLPASVFAASPAAWLCVACWTERHVIGRVVGVGVGNA
jgi:hypothetical protein